jgi:hypothetical protein
MSVGWYKKMSPEKRREYLDKQNLKKKKLYWKNPEKYRKESLESISRNKDKVKARKLKYRQNNQEKLIVYEKQRWIKIKDHKKEYERKRRADDINFILSRRLRSRIRSALKYVLDGQGKNCKTLDLLGCTIEEFKIYIESKFQSGMTWDKKSEIHIDHIIPISSFDLTDPNQQKQCFHYKNLQPLWRIDNQRKSNKIQ